MKIVFLCGSLEPGMDGVGDYTRMLAAELIRQGHHAVAVALNDKQLNAEREETQQSGDIELLVYRLPNTYPYKKSFAFAKAWIDLFNPDWISLHYVPYSFQNKGLPFSLARHLLKLGDQRLWHIMFHELWIGFTTISPFKHRVTGIFQKRIAQKIVKVLQPPLITTTNRLYQLLLQNSGIKAAVLPLFSNISIAAPDNFFMEKVLTLLSIPGDAAHKWRLIGIFGNLYPEAELEETIKQQLQLSTSMNKRLAFIGFGRMNVSGIEEFKRLEKLFSDKVRFVHLGEQPSENVSRLFQILDVGVSCTPSQHIGKSGVFAAMKLHGLQVILPNDQFIPEYYQEIKQYREALLKRPAFSWSVDFISRQFLNLINQ